MDVSAGRIDTVYDAEQDVSRSSRRCIWCDGPLPPPPSPLRPPEARRSRPPSQPPSPPPSSNRNSFRRDADGYGTDTFTVIGTFAFKLGSGTLREQRAERTSEAYSSYQETVQGYLNNPMNEGMVAPRRLAVRVCSFRYINEDDTAGYDTSANWCRYKADCSSLSPIPVNEQRPPGQGI